jgi:hypothetical protein
MASITGTQLKTLINKCFYKLICQKNDYIKLGKNVTKINNQLIKMFNYWGGNSLQPDIPPIIDCCDLTQAQMDCILQDVIDCKCTIELSDLNL